MAGGDFLYLSAPRPIVAPGTPFAGDLQAWIRNSDLAPDWLRIGTDIIGRLAHPAHVQYDVFPQWRDRSRAGTPG